MVNWHKHCRGIWDIVTDSRIIDVVSDLLGDTVVLRHSHLFAKLPATPSGSAGTRTPPTGRSRPAGWSSAWLAIDDVDVDNSAMHVIPGSHHHAQLTFHDSAEEENKVLFQTVRDAEAWGESPVALEMRANHPRLDGELIPRKEDP